MYSDYFISTQADYINEIFDFYPESSISFSATKHQNSSNGIDDIKFVSHLSESSEGSFSFSIENLSIAERDEILDIFINENKANGISNSFLFKHPIYNEYFVCRFSGQITDSLYRHERYSYDKIDLDIIGIDRNLINIDSWIVGEEPTEEYIYYI
jgi:hypothetical protein